MDFNEHSTLEGLHAFLSPSKHHWLNYNEDKLDQAYFAALQAQRGTEMHDLAQRLIRLRVNLPDIPKTLNMYVNDCIGYRLRPEQTLFYSVNCFGQVDAIGYRAPKLRVADLKTGITPASEYQLEIYAALFCLEYKVPPLETEFELRIYQNDDVRLFLPGPDEIFSIMEKIKTFDKRIRNIREEL